MGKFWIMRLLRRKKANDKTELIAEDTNRKTHFKKNTWPIPGHIELPIIHGENRHNRTNEIEDSKICNPMHHKKEGVGCFKWKSKGHVPKEKNQDKPRNKDIERIKIGNNIFRIFRQRKDRGSKHVTRRSKVCDSRSLEGITSYDYIECMRKSWKADVDIASDVTYVGNGNAIVTDSKNGMLMMIDCRGNPIMVYHTGDLFEPSSLVLTTNGYIAIASSENKRVFLLSRSGEIVRCFGHDVMHRPSGIAVLKNGAFIVTDVRSRQVLIFNENGTFIKYLNTPGHQFIYPRFIAVSPNGSIIISDTGANCLKVFNENGKCLRVIGEYGSADGQFKHPYGIETDVAGNILVADHGNNRVSLFDTHGHFICHILTSKQGIWNPQGISLSSDSTIFVTYGEPSHVKIAAFKIKSPIM